MRRVNELFVQKSAQSINCRSQKLDTDHVDRQPSAAEFVDMGEHGRFVFCHDERGKVRDIYQSGNQRIDAEALAMRHHQTRDDFAFYHYAEPGVAILGLI